MITHFYQYFQILSLLVAIFCYRGLRACSLQAFILFLLISNATELIAGNYKAFGWTANYFVYNIYLLTATPVQLYLLGKMLHLKPQEKPVYLLISFLLILVIILNYFFLQGTFRFNTFSLILIEIVTIMLSCLALLRIAVQRNDYQNLINAPYFWINAANLLFALITLVLLGLQQYIVNNHIQLGKKSLYYAILPGVNIIIYSAYSYAFILCRTIRNR